MASEQQPTQRQLPPVIANAVPPVVDNQLLHPAAQHPVHPQAPTSNQSTFQTSPLPPIPSQILETIISGAYIDSLQITV